MLERLIKRREKEALVDIDRPVINLSVPTGVK